MTEPLNDKPHSLDMLAAMVIAGEPLSSSDRLRIAGAVTRAARAVESTRSHVAPNGDDASPFGLVLRLKKEADKWSGTSCRSEEQFFLRDLIREAARMIETRVVAAPSTTERKSYLAAQLTDMIGHYNIHGWDKHIIEETISALSAIAPSVLDAAKKALRTYVWKVQHPTAPIAGYASFDAAMVELRDALLAAGEAPDFGTTDGGKQT